MRRLIVLYFTTGTRIIYERKFLLKMQNSPLSRSPPKNMPSIPGVTLTKFPLSSPPISTSPQPPSVTSPAKKESDTALRQEGIIQLTIVTQNEKLHKICDQILETVPNHTLLFHYIYHCHMKSITFSIIFHGIQC